MERRCGQAGILSRIKEVVYEKTRGAECPLLKKPHEAMLQESGKVIDVFNAFNEVPGGSAKAFWRRQPQGKLTANS